MSSTFYLILPNLMLSFIPAGIAKTKGRSFVGYLLISFFLSFAIGMLMILCQDDLTDKVQKKIRCGICGARLRGNQKYCHKCGSNDLQLYLRKEPSSFVGRYLGLIILGVMFIMALWISSASEVAFSWQGLRLQLMQLMTLVLVAVGFVLSLRAKGPDLSLPSMMGLTAVVAAAVTNDTGSFEVGVTAALLACAIAGAVNGWVAVYLKIPSVIPTLVMSQILRLICIRMTGGYVIQGDFPAVATGSLGIRTIIWITPLLVIMIGFMLVCFTRLGKPLHVRKAGEIKRPLAAATFVFSALLAGFAGLLILMRLQVANAQIGESHMWFLFLLFGAIMSKRSADNRYMPVIYAVIVSVVYTLLSSSMNFHGISSYYQYILLFLFSAAFMVVTFFTNRQPVRQMMRFNRQMNNDSSPDVTQGV